MPGLLINKITNKLVLPNGLLFSDFDIHKRNLEFGIITQKSKILHAVLEYGTPSDPKSIAVGGVGSVISSLTIVQQKRKDIDARVITPYYPKLHKNLNNCDVITEVKHWFNGERVTSKILKTTTDNGVTIYLVEADPRQKKLFDNVLLSEYIYSDLNDSKFIDRCGYVTGAIAAFALEGDGFLKSRDFEDSFVPHIIQGHSWSMSLIGALIKQYRNSYGIDTPKTLYTVHSNHSSDNHYDNKDIPDIGITISDAHVFLSQIAINGYDHLVYVSEQLLKESICKKRSIFSQDIFKRYQQGDVSVILNNVCAKQFNPSVCLPPTFRFDLNNIYDGKLKIKRHLNKVLLSKINKKINEDKPLTLYLGRYSPEKGIDQLDYAIKEVLRQGGAFIGMGNGEPDIIQALKEKYKDNINVIFFTHKKEQEEYGKLIRAAADFYFVPSKTEACGLIPMEANIGGAIVLSSRAGGLVDVVKPDANGMRFTTSHYIQHALKLLHETWLELYKSHNHEDLNAVLKAIQESAVKTFDWEADNVGSLKSYADLYKTMMIKNPVSVEKKVILHICLEYNKTSLGGVGEMVTSLSKEMHKNNNLDVMVITPHFPWHDTLIEENLIKEQQEKIQGKINIINNFKSYGKICEVVHTYNDKEIKSQITKVINDGITQYLIKPVSCQLTDVEQKELFGDIYKDQQIKIFQNIMPKISYFNSAVAAFIMSNNPLPPKIDLLNAHGWGCGLVARIIKDHYRKNKPKCILTVHSEFSEHGAIESSNRTAIEILKKTSLSISPDKHGNLSILKEGMLGADHVVYVSKTLRKQATEHIGLFSINNICKKLDAEGKATAIVNGISNMFDPKNLQKELLPKLNFDNLAAGKHAAKEKFNQMIKDINSTAILNTNEINCLRDKALNSDKPLIIFVGRFLEEKGIDVLQVAIERTIEKGGNFVVMGLYGAQKEDKEIKFLADKYKNNSNVIILHEKSYVVQKKYGPLIRFAADFTFIPSYRESCGLVSMEAQLNGSLVISSNAGGLNDTVKEKTTGFMYQNTNNSKQRNNHVIDAIDRAFRFFDDLSRIPKNHNVKLKELYDYSVRNYLWDGAEGSILKYMKLIDKLSPYLPKIVLRHQLTARISRLTKEQLIQNPGEIISILKNNEKLQQLYSKPIGIGKDSIEQYTLRVLNLAVKHQRYLSEKLSPNLEFKEFMLFLALYNIYRGLSEEHYEEGVLHVKLNTKLNRKDLELLLTRRIIKSILKELKWPTNKIKLCSRLLHSDTISEYLTGELLPSSLGAYQLIIRDAVSAAIKPKKLFDIFIAFHKVDAGSNMALSHIFETDPEKSLQYNKSCTKRINRIRNYFNLVANGKNILTKFANDENLSLDITKDTMTELDAYLTYIHMQMINDFSRNGTNNQYKFEMILNQYKKVLQKFITLIPVDQLAEFHRIYKENIIKRFTEKKFINYVVSRADKYEYFIPILNQNINLDLFINNLENFRKDFLVRYKVNLLKSTLINQIGFSIQFVDEKIYDLLQITMNHGSKSSTFTNVPLTANKLFPGGVLSKLKVVPISGENSIGITATGINQQNISTTLLDHVDFAIKEFAENELQNFEINVGIQVNTLITLVNKLSGILERIIQDNKIDQLENNQQKINDFFEYMQGQQVPILIKRIKYIDSTALDPIKHIIKEFITKLEETSNAYKTTSSYLEYKKQPQSKGYISHKNLEYFIVETKKALEEAVLTNSSLQEYIDNPFPVIYASDKLLTNNKFIAIERLLPMGSQIGKDIKYIFVDKEHIPATEKWVDIIITQHQKKPIIMDLDKLKQAYELHKQLSKTGIYADVLGLNDNNIILSYDLHKDFIKKGSKGKKGGKGFGGIYRKKDNNRDYLVKITSDYHDQNNEFRSHQEVLASRLALACGVGVPKMYEVLQPTNNHATDIYVASEIIQNATDFKVEQIEKLPETDKQNILSDCVVHAWLCNRDLINIDGDNFVKDQDGRIYNVDLGNCLLAGFRAWLRHLTPDIINFNDDPIKLIPFINLSDSNKFKFKNNNGQYSKQEAQNKEQLLKLHAKDGEQAKICFLMGILKIQSLTDTQIEILVNSTNDTIDNKQAIIIGLKNRREALITYAKLTYGKHAVEEERIALDIQKIMHKAGVFSKMPDTIRGDSGVSWKAQFQNAAKPLVKILDNAISLKYHDAAQAALVRSEEIFEKLKIKKADIAIIDDTIIINNLPIEEFHKIIQENMVADRLQILLGSYGIKDSSPYDLPNQKYRTPYKNLDPYKGANSINKMRPLVTIDGNNLTIEFDEILCSKEKLQQLLTNIYGLLPEDYNDFVNSNKNNNIIINNSKKFIHLVSTKLGARKTAVISENAAGKILAGRLDPIKKIKAGFATAGGTSDLPMNPIAAAVIEGGDEFGYPIAQKSLQPIGSTLINDEQNIFLSLPGGTSEIKGKVDYEEFQRGSIKWYSFEEFRKSYNDSLANGNTPTKFDRSSVEYYVKHYQREIQKQLQTLGLKDFIVICSKKPETLGVIHIKPSLQNTLDTNPTQTINFTQEQLEILNSLLQPREIIFSSQIKKSLIKKTSKEEKYISRNIFTIDEKVNPATFLAALKNTKLSKQTVRYRQS